MGLNKRMLGRFRVSAWMFESGIEALRHIMSEMIVTYVRRSTLGAHYTYTAISPLFREVPEGEAIPRYKISVGPGIENIEVDAQEQEGDSWPDD